MAEFNVSKGGRLLQTHNGILDGSGATTFCRDGTGTCVFLDSEQGDLLQISVPFHAVVNQSSAAHDLMQQQKLTCLVKEKDKAYGEMVSEAGELLRACRTSAGRMAIIMDVCKSDRFEKRDVLGYVDETLKSEEDKQKESEEGDITVKPIVIFLRHIQAIAEVHELFASVGEFEWETKSADEQLKHYSGPAKALPSFLERLEEATKEEVKQEEKPGLSLSDLLCWFDVSAEKFNSDAAQVQADTKSAKDILLGLCWAVQADKDKMVDLFKKTKVTPESLIAFIFKTLSCWSNHETKKLWPCLKGLFALIFAIKDESVHAFNLVAEVRTAIHGSAITVPLYFALHGWRDHAAPLANGMFVKEAEKFVGFAEAYLNCVTSMPDECEVPYHEDLPKILDKVYACNDIVDIDYYIPGCPPDANHIWKSVLSLVSGQPIAVPYSELKYD